MKWPCELYTENFIFHCDQGGIFVLEPQPWRSYENNRRVSEVLILLGFSFSY